MLSKRVELFSESDAWQAGPAEAVASWEGMLKLAKVTGATLITLGLRVP